MSKAASVAGAFRTSRHTWQTTVAAAMMAAVVVSAAWMIAALGLGSLTSPEQRLIVADSYRDFGLRVTPAGTVESYPDLGLRITPAGTVESYPDLGLRITPAAPASEPYADFGLRHRPASDQ